MNAIMLVLFRVGFIFETKIFYIRYRLIAELIKSYRYSLYKSNIDLLFIGSKLFKIAKKRQTEKIIIIRKQIKKQKEKNIIIERKSAMKKIFL